MLEPTEYQPPPSEEARFEQATPISLPEALRAGLHLQYLKLAAQEQHEIGTVNDDKISGTLVDCAQILRSSTLETSIRHQLVLYNEKISEKYEPTENIDEDDAKELEQKAATWQRVLREDLQREQRVPVSDTGVLDVDRLLNNPEKLLSEPVWNWLDSRPQKDIQEACKTLVVGCSTSSVFLSLRAVEHCLGKWYIEQMGEELNQEGWGEGLSQLIEEFLEDTNSNDMLEQLGELPPVLTNLYYLKEKRNEVNHPEKSPDSQEARRTLLIIASTITDIYNEIVETHTIEYHSVEVQIPKEGDDEDIIKAIIAALDSVTHGGVTKEEIHDCADQIGYEKENVNEHIESLFMSGHIYEPADNVLKTI